MCIVDEVTCYDCGIDWPGPRPSSLKHGLFQLALHRILMNLGPRSLLAHRLSTHTHRTHSCFSTSSSLTADHPARTNDFGYYFTDSTDFALAASAHFPALNCLQLSQTDLFVYGYLRERYRDSFHRRLCSYLRRPSCDCGCATVSRQGLCLCNYYHCVC